MFYTDGNTFLIINFKHFDFIELFDLSSSSNSFYEILSIKNFLVDFSMCLWNSFIVLEILKFSLLRSILINL